GLHRFMPILAQNAGAAVKELSVAHYPRVSGKSNYGVWNRLGRGIYDLLMVRWLMKRQFIAFVPESVIEVEIPQWRVRTHQALQRCNRYHLVLSLRIPTRG